MALPEWLTEARSYVQTNPVRAHILIRNYGGLRAQKIPARALPVARSCVRELSERLAWDLKLQQEASVLLVHIESRIAKEASFAKDEHRRRMRQDKEYARQVARREELVAVGVKPRRAEALSCFREGPYSVVITGTERGVDYSRYSSPLIQKLHTDLGYSQREAVEVVERAVHISPETLAFDLGQRDAVHIKVLLEGCGARMKIESAPRRDAAERRPSIPEAVRNEVWRRDGGRCVDCGSRENLHFDHIVPWSRGGSNTARNLELRCETCNLRKGAKV
jgi:HNH endonuclease